MSSLRQEFYKFFHQRSVLYTTLLLPILMMLIAFTNHSDIKWMLTNNFAASYWNIFIAVGVGANLFSMEYRNNTMPTLIYKNKTRSLVYYSKLIVMLVYAVILQLLSFILTIVLSMILFSDKYNLFTYHQNGHLLIYNIAYTASISLIGLVFMLCVTFMIASFTKSNTVALIVGIAVSLFGQNLSEILMSGSRNVSSILKWSPLNMTNVVGQLTFHGEDYSYIHKLTQLSNVEMLSGTVIYSLLFLIIGYLLFNRKKV